MGNKSKKDINLSIIIPTYNEERDVQECLNSLKKQIYKKFEIIIVDDGSTDKTIEIVKKFKDVKIIKGEHRGPGFSRNIGAKNAQGEILVFVDADMTFDRDYLKNLIKPLLKDKEKKIIGTTHETELVKNIDNIWSRCWGNIRVSKEQSKEVKIFRAIRKNKFLEFRGFDPKYGYADDQTFWFKYQIKPIVAKDTLCFHKNPETLQGVYNQSIWIGSSINHTLFEAPIIKYLSPLLLLIFLFIAIPILSIKKVMESNDYKILPWMIFFMAYRYLGTIKGISDKIYFNKYYEN